jgi:hypothetical protein
MAGYIGNSGSRSVVLVDSFTKGEADLHYYSKTESDNNYYSKSAVDSAISNIDVSNLDPTTLNLPTAPSANPTLGDVYFDTDLNSLRAYNGSSFTVIGGSDGTSFANAANSATEIYAVNPSSQDGLYWIKFNGRPPEQMYVYFNKQFASEGPHNYVVLSNYGGDMVGTPYFTDNATWPNQGTIDATLLNEAYSRLEFLDGYGGIDGTYYFWLQNTLVGNDELINWVASQTVNPWGNAGNSLAANGVTLIYREPETDGWGDFGGWRDQSNLDLSTGQIVGTSTSSNWFWNTSSGQWGSGIPTANGVIWTDGVDVYDLGDQGNGESSHNTFAVAN